MSGYLIVNYRVTNPEGFNTYMAGVMPTIAAHGGEILVAGPGSTAIEGSPDPITVVVKFPSREAVQTWYDSPEYQAIIHHRLDNTEGTAVIADGFKVPGQ